MRAQYSALAASQWLSVRLQMIGVVMVFIIAFACVTESRYLNVETGLQAAYFCLLKKFFNFCSFLSLIFLGLIALALTYSLSLTNILSSLLTSFIDTEKELVSVERISDYIENVPLEKTTLEIEKLDKFLVCDFFKLKVNFLLIFL